MSLSLGKFDTLYFFVVLFLLKLLRLHIWNLFLTHFRKYSWAGNMFSFTGHTAISVHKCEICQEKKQDAWWEEGRLLFFWGMGCFSCKCLWAFGKKKCISLYSLIDFVENCNEIYSSALSNPWLSLHDKMSFCNQTFDFLTFSHFFHFPLIKRSCFCKAYFSNQFC